jgi:hypothetical protein
LVNSVPQRDSTIPPFEEWRALIAQPLPKPVTHKRTSSKRIASVVGGDPARVVVRISQRSLTVYSRGEWIGAQTLTVCHRRIGAMPWSELPRETALCFASELIKTAREWRCEEFRFCTSCGQQTGRTEAQRSRMRRKRRRVVPLTESSVVHEVYWSYWRRRAIVSTNGCQPGAQTDVQSADEHGVDRLHNFDRHAASEPITVEDL